MQHLQIQAIRFWIVFRIRKNTMKQMAKIIEMEIISTSVITMVLKVRQIADWYGM